MAEIETVAQEKEAPRPEPTIFAVPKTALGGFLDFVRERGITGLAIGFVFGTSVQKLVTAFVTDVINPLVSVVGGSASNLDRLAVGPFLLGDLLSNFIDFVLLITVVYLFFKAFRLDKFDKQKG